MKAKIPVIADTFVRRNYRAYFAVSEIIGAVSTLAGENGAHIETPLGRKLCGLDDTLAAMEPRFSGLGLSGDPIEIHRASVKLVQDFRFVVYDAILACLTPVNGDSDSIPGDVSNIAEAMDGNRALLAPTSNFPQPEDKDYPPEVLCVWDIFIWQRPWYFSDADPEISGLVETLENALGEPGFPRNDLPYVESAVSLLRLLRELIRPARVEEPDVDFAAVTQVRKPALNAAAAPAECVPQNAS